MYIYKQAINSENELDAYFVSYIPFDDHGIIIMVVKKQPPHTLELCDFHGP